MTKRTAQIENAILDGLANGISLEVLCGKHAISRAAFYKWVQKDPELAKRHARAETAHADALVDQCIRIADDARRDWIERQDKPGMAFDCEHFRRVKIRIETRIKVAAQIERRRERKFAADPAPNPAPKEERVNLVALLDYARAKTGIPNG